MVLSLTWQIAPATEGTPQEIPAPSKTGPAAVEETKSFTPSEYAISPLVPRSAKRNVEAAYKDANKQVENLALTRFDIERILLILEKQDKIERIYINFCNPWPKGKHRKKRLTHTRQLEKYKEFLVPGGKIYFKTDDIDLFNSSLIYFKESGFEIIKQTNDLHKEELNFWNDIDNIETEHEKMFSEQGIKINALIAKLK